MKEIGKLIELLNEYQKENGPEWISFYEKNGYLECQIEHYVSAYGYEDDYRVDMEYGVEILISKSFGFIKWLVENDKIDKRKIDTRLVRNVESHYDEDGYWVENSYEDYSDTDTLLMLLSISSSPIDDLISYLR